MKKWVKPGWYQWSGVTVSTMLAISSGLLLFFGASDWYKGMLRPPFALPLGLLAPFQTFSLIMAGFASRIVMGNVSGNPAVKPARKVYSIWLVIHGLWLISFSGFHLAELSMAISFIQLGVAFVCVQKFFNVDPRAGTRILGLTVMTAYWLYLNFGILSLNNAY
jgi:tryptophan-rich sensory protein